MNEKQKQIIETFGFGQSVIAGAGCGKTTTLVAKCLALLKNKSTARFCAVSFTEKSVRDLKESLAKGFQTARLDPSHWVKTIHGLCSTIIQEFPVSAGLQGGERILLEDEAKRLWIRSVNILWSSNENAEISEAVDRLLQTYSRKQLETLFAKLRTLMSFGVDRFIKPEMTDLWLVFQSIYHRYQHSKDRDGALDFNDLELFALKALKDPSVRTYYQSRFDLVLVDEFQDTNPIQGEILELFVKPDFSNLCIVGDPKQSIYRFRDADVSVFQDLTLKLPKKHLLDTNYRSRPGIIDFVNQVCKPTFEASEIPYEPLEAGRDEDAPAQTRVSRLEIDSEDDLAAFLKSEQHRGVDLSEYVILARSVRKDKTAKFLRALDTAKIPFLLGSGGRFYSDVRVQELISFLRGWISPKNTLSQVAALRAPWIGLTDAELLQIQETEKDVYFETFFKTSPHSVAIALRDDYLSFDRVTRLRPGEVLEKLIKIDQFDESFYLPLVTLWHKAEELSGQGRRFEEVVQYFSEAMETEKIEKEIPAPAERGMVRLLTVHSSKGLQFPRVILLDFDGEYKSPAMNDDLIWDRKRGVHLFNRDEDGKRDSDDVQNVVWTKIEKQAQVAESKRVFYVALTRAQEELILVWKKEIKRSKASEAPDFNPHLSDNWRAWTEASLIPEQKIFNRTEVSSDPEVTRFEVYQAKNFQNFDPESFRPRHSPSEWLILNQCERRYRKKYGMVLDETEEKSRVVYLTDLETEKDEEVTAPRSEIAEKGERIHSLIEHENWHDLQAEFQNSETGSKIVESLQKVLSRDLNWKIYRELGFEAPLGAYEALVGMMDRLEVNETEKTIRIVDYKFTAKPKSKEALLLNYELQLKLYLWAATKLIDFIPEKLEAELIHFTVNSVEMIEVDPSRLSLPAIEKEVFGLFEKARGVGSNATLGDYCRYCEVSSDCPSFMAKSKI